jgi:cysteine-rich repeat protein
VAAYNLSTSLSISICGDGIVQQSELCDAGTGNFGNSYASSIASRMCNEGCENFGPYCGDGILQVRFGEQCDDGNNTSGDLCSASCQAEAPAVPGGAGGSPTVGSTPQIPGANPGTIASEIPTKVVLRGKAYPNSNVKILLDSKVLGTVQADNNADFLYTTTNVTPGTATFSFLATDSAGISSITQSVVFDVLQSAVTTVANIFLPPTIAVSSDSVAPGDLLTISGQTVPGAQVLTQITPTAGSSTLSASADAAGKWAIQLDTSSFATGYHATKAYFQISDQVKSGFGRAINFFIGKGAPPGQANADVNGDGKVNLVDFSIFLTNWGTSNAQSDFNSDGKVNLADFSILLFNWTG